MPDVVTSVPSEGDGERWSDMLTAVAESRDRAAFAELFDHFAPRVKSFMMRLGVVDARAEELAQEAMLTVWRKANLFDPCRASAGTWIFTIARNLRVDQLRQERRPEIEPDDPLLTSPPGPLPDERLDIQRREDSVRRAMAALSVDQAEVVRLSFYEDTPHSEIAARLKIPLGTVKSRLRLAMKRIGSLLGDQE